MSFLKWTLALVLAIVTIAAAGMLASRRLQRPPMTVCLLSLTNDSSGGQMAYFQISNSTGKTLDYLSDGTARPYYSLCEVLPPDPATGRVVGTNHNQQAFASVRRATLAPHASVPFPVRIPQGATAAVLTLNYMRQPILFEETVAEVKLADGRPLPPSQAYQNILLYQPFK